MGWGGVGRVWLLVGIIMFEVMIGDDLIGGDIFFYFYRYIFMHLGWIGCMHALFTWVG